MTLTSVMEDFRLAEEQCKQSVEQKKAHHGFVDRVGRRKEGSEGTSLEQEMKVYDGIRLVKRMVLLAADSIRKDAVYLPLIVSLYNITFNKPVKI